SVHIPTGSVHISAGSVYIPSGSAAESTVITRTTGIVTETEVVSCDSEKCSSSTIFYTSSIVIEETIFSSTIEGLSTLKGNLAETSSLATGDYSESGKIDEASNTVVNEKVIDHPLPSSSATTLVEAIKESSTPSYGTVATSKDYSYEQASTLTTKEINAGTGEVSSSLYVENPEAVSTSVESSPKVSSYVPEQPTIEVATANGAAIPKAAISSTVLCFLGLLLL
ncbi:uncharacterized protein ASCRUDRAFT_8737, partial [Ascoidea rubescens DSM 1968]